MYFFFDDVITDFKTNSASQSMKIVEKSFSFLFISYDAHDKTRRQGIVDLGRKYRISLHQDLYDNDFIKHVNFCNWIRRKIRTDVSFSSHVLFSEEANFASTGNVNRNYMHYCANENPRWMRTVPF